MPRQYSGRHRAAAPAAAGRHRSTVVKRSPAQVVKPLTISALSLGTTLVVVQTAMNAPFGSPDAVAGGARPAAMALAAGQGSPSSAALMNGVGGPRSGASAPATPSPTAGGVATATMTPTAPAATTTTTPPVAPTPDQSRSWVLPVKSYVLSSMYGPRWGTMHAGIDLAAPTGTPVMAMSTGVVTWASWQGGYGNKIEIRYWDGTVSYYGHLSAINVRVGQTVAPGEVVGAVGSTGDSTGPHLHLEIHPKGQTPVDPAPWMGAHSVPVR